MLTSEQALLWDTDTRAKTVHGWDATAPTLSGAPVQATHEELPAGRGGSGQPIPLGCPTHSMPTGRGMCSVTLWVAELSTGLLAPILWQTQEITLLAQKWPCQSQSTRKRATVPTGSFCRHVTSGEKLQHKPKRQSTRERLMLGHGPTKPRTTVAPERPGDPSVWPSFQGQLHSERSSSNCIRWPMASAESTHCHLRHLGAQEPCNHSPPTHTQQSGESAPVALLTDPRQDTWGKSLSKKGPQSQRHHHSKTQEICSAR